MVLFHRSTNRKSVPNVYSHMPAIDAPSYELFDLKHYDEQPLPLDEASEKVAKMRKNAPGEIHRVVPADARGERFYVESLDPLQLYAEIGAKLSARWAKLLSRQ